MHSYRLPLAYTYMFRSSKPPFGWLDDKLLDAPLNGVGRNSEEASRLYTGTEMADMRLGFVAYLRLHAPSPRLSFNTRPSIRSAVRANSTPRIWACGLAAAPRLAVLTTLFEIRSTA